MQYKEVRVPAWVPNPDPVSGARVDVLATGIAQAGEHRVEWTPASSLPTGLYCVCLEAQGRCTTRAVVLTR